MDSLAARIGTANEKVLHHPTWSRWIILAKRFEFKNPWIVSSGRKIESYELRLPIETDTSRISMEAHWNLFDVKYFFNQIIIGKRSDQTFKADGFL